MWGRNHQCLRDRKRSKQCAVSTCKKSVRRTSPFTTFMGSPVAESILDIKSPYPWKNVTGLSWKPNRMADMPAKESRFSSPSSGVAAIMDSRPWASRTTYERPVIQNQWENPAWLRLLATLHIFFMSKCLILMYVVVVEKVWGEDLMELGRILRKMENKIISCHVFAL